MEFGFMPNSCTQPESFPFLQGWSCVLYPVHHFRFGSLCKLHDDFAAVNHDNFTDPILGFIHLNQLLDKI